MPAAEASGHASDSHDQRLAEPLILASVGEELGVELAPRSLRLEDGARVDVDGVAPDESVLVEVYAHQGASEAASSTRSRETRSSSSP
jgi:hypothetical protein